MGPICRYSLEITNFHIPELIQVFRQLIQSFARHTLAQY